MRRLAAAALALVALVVLAAPTSARSAFCRPIRDSRAEVVALSASLGCGSVRDVALATTSSSLGYYKSKRWYCRWGQGGTRPVRHAGHTYYSGFCASVPGFRTATFLGRRLS